MATIKMIRETEKSYLVLVKQHAWEFAGRPAYVAKAQELTEGDVVNIPDGFVFKPMIDQEGNPITTQDGQPKHTLVWE